MTDEQSHIIGRRRFLEMSAVSALALGVQTTVPSFVGELSQQVPAQTRERAITPQPGVASAAAGHWPQFCGPNRDNISPETVERFEPLVR